MKRAALAGVLIFPVLIGIVSPVIDSLGVTEGYFLQHELVKWEIGFKLRHDGAARGAIGLIADLH